MKKWTSKICMKFWMWLDSISYKFFNWYLKLQWPLAAEHTVRKAHTIKKKKRKKVATHILKERVTKVHCHNSYLSTPLTVYFLSLSRVLSEQINKFMNLQSTEKNKCLKTEYFFVLNFKPGALNPQFSDLIWSQWRKQLWNEITSIMANKNYRNLKKQMWYWRCSSPNTTKPNKTKT